MAKEQRRLDELELGDAERAGVIPHQVDPRIEQGVAIETGNRPMSGIENPPKDSRLLRTERHRMVSRPVVVLNAIVPGYGDLLHGV